MANQTIYLGVAPMTMVRTRSAGYVSVFRGDAVPADALPEDIKRLTEEGYIVASEIEVPDAEPDVEPEPAPAKRRGSSS